MDTYSFHCSVCGKCCNTPPQMSVPELFHHQDLFVGCLSIRRIKRLVEGTRLSFGAHSYVIDKAQDRAYAALAGELLFPSVVLQDSGYDFAIASQAFDYDSQGRCPALAGDGRCGIYSDEKPAMCAVVPLDALFPDCLQHLVLASRNTEAAYSGTACIAAGAHPGFSLLTRGKRVADSSFAHALARRREALTADRQWWGDAVYQMLQQDLFALPAASRRIPANGFFSISMVPVLSVLAAVSARCRERCLTYIEAQLALIEEKIRQALARRLSEDRPVTQELRAWSSSYRALKEALEAEAPLETMARGSSGDENRRSKVEAWLGAIPKSDGPSGPTPPLPVPQGSNGRLDDSKPPEETIVQAAQQLHISPDVLRTYLDAGQGELHEGVKRYLHAVIKPVGSVCNLDCTYCYYRSKEDLLQQKGSRIDDRLLEAYIADYINSQDVDEVQFTWHGGEPTLIGLDFFRKVVSLQAKHTPPGRRVSNDLQTNGTLLTDEWCKFLAENEFLVGLSIDGPKELHDLYRLTNKGDSSYDQVYAASRRLTKHKVRFGTMTTVNRRNASRGAEVYRFLRDDLGAKYMQFIPCVEPREFEHMAPGSRGKSSHSDVDIPMFRPGLPQSPVTSWSVDPYEWGDFLCAVFDHWIAADVGTIKINLFETIIAQMKGRPAMLCTTSPFCGKNVAVEHDGRVYACDHYVYPEYEIGRIGEQSLSQIVFSVKQLGFGLSKYNALPVECRKCKHLSLCGGDCPRTRILRTQGGGGGNQSYLCKGWKKFFKHALPVLQRTHVP